MITDALLLLSVAQAVTASAVSTNTVDLGVARDIGAGEPLYVSFHVTTNFATLTSLTPNLIISANADLSSATVIASGPAIPVASLVAGYKTYMRIPPIADSIGKRYFGASYTVTGSNATAGAISAEIVKDVEDGAKYYPSGYTVAA